MSFIAELNGIEVGELVARYKGPSPGVEIAIVDAGSNGQSDWVLVVAQDMAIERDANEAIEWTVTREDHYGDLAYAMVEFTREAMREALLP